MRTNYVKQRENRAYTVCSYLFLSIDEVVMEDDWAGVLGHLQNLIFMVLFSTSLHTEFFLDTEREGAEK
jgi:hypothetical protein